MICAYIIALVVLLDNRISCFGNQLHGACKSPQYLEFGKTGTIHCFFDEDVIGVLWYNTTNYENHNPIVDFQYQVKTGAGYLSGEFDVDQNGSLVIYNVSLKHDKAFHVAAVLLAEGPQSIGDINIIVFTKPSTDFPLIDKCWNTSNVCYSNVYDPLIHCSVVNARPSIPLNLKVRTVVGDKNISTNVSVNTDEQKFTSIVSTINVFQYTPLLSLLVCQASSPPEVLKTNESQILVQNKRFDIRVKLEQAVRYYADQSKKMELTCADNLARWLVWKRVSFAHTEHEVLMYSVSTMKHLSKKFVTDAIMGTNGSFVVPLMDVRHEGVYYCIYGDGKTDGVTAYNVSVVVHPVPAYPIIEECKSIELEERKPPCQFKAKREGTLTCRVKNVRPLVKLEWKTLKESDSGFISFRNLNQTNKDNGETFDVTLTTMYSLKNLFLDQLTIQCTVLESNEVHVGLMSTLELSFEKDNGAENGNEVKAPNKHRMIIIVAILGAIVLFIAVFISAVAVKRKFIGNRSRSSSPTTPQNIEEETPFVSLETSKPEDHLDSKATSSDDGMVIDLDERRRSLIDELRIKYRALYNAVQPIALPSYQGHRSVNDIFVESDIQFLKSIEGGCEEWQNLDSYADIFNVLGDHLNRIILEGDVGYGKSTLTLQIAYDWCNNKTNPVLRDVEILILLRLRQTGDVFSIYKSIKCFLLPDNCDIGEREIEKVLKNTKSVLLILDGFDEYPSRNEPNSDMMKIFRRDMFPLFKVILTTRSSISLPKLPPQTTRIRLGGFTENVRKTYIRNVVVNGNHEAAERLEKRLQHNPLVRNFCKTPSFFVMFAHLLQETDDKLKLNSVTSVMAHATTWLQHHADVKLTDDKAVSKRSFSADDREKIGKVAFKVLCGILWTKEELCQHLGTDLYDTLIQTGMLVEEEKLGHANASFSEPFESKIEVRFYNQVFCEWYAAYFLAGKGTANNFSNKFEDAVKKMNRSDLQYVYRFACGIATLRIADKIIKLFNKKDGGDILAILCRIECNKNFETVKDIIRQRCSEGIIISGHDGMFLQRSCIQFLEIAAKNNIPIAYVNLYDSFERADLSTKNIVSTSGLVLSSTIPFKKLMVCCNNRKMDEDKFTNILELSSKCQTLRVVRFFGSVPPRSFEVTNTLSTLDSKGVKVHWRLFEDEPQFILNLKTGKWEREKDRKLPTSEDFKKMRSRFATDLEDWSDDYGVQDVKDARKRIREKAERRRNPQLRKKRNKKLRKEI